MLFEHFYQVFAALIAVVYTVDQCYAALQCGYSPIQHLKGNSLQDDQREKESHLIVGGQVARRNSWPWMVFIEDLKKEPRLLCGGSIITNQWILTAAHCVEPYINQIQDFRVTLGAHVMSEKSNSKITLKIKKGIVYPGYIKATIENDIGLYLLERPIKFDIRKPILPVCLPQFGEKLAVGQMTYVTGWGLQKGIGGKTSDVLKQAMVPIIPFEECLKIYAKNQHKPAVNTFCTHYMSEGGHNSCMGDSGSPLVVKRNNVWVQYGVVSWGLTKCASADSPSIYTKVSAYVPWIKSVILGNQNTA